MRAGSVALIAMLFALTPTGAGVGVDDRPSLANLADVAIWGAAALCKCSCVESGGSCEAEGTICVCKPTLTGACDCQAQDPLREANAHPAEDRFA